MVGPPYGSEHILPQTRESGAAAAAYGRAMGRALACLLGARLVRNGSNEVEWDGRRGVIKSCRLANTSFGITAAMLYRLDVALVAIEDRLGAYDIYELGIGRFRERMRDSRSGPADGRVQLLSRVEAERHGRRIGRFTALEIAEATRPL